MTKQLSRYLGISSALVALLSVAACGSGADSSGPLPGIVDEGVSAKDLSCINTRPADPTSLSQDLASICGCSPYAFHESGLSEHWDVVDCSSSTAACVNGVLDTNGYRDPTWNAYTTSYACAPLAVVFDPCNTCRGGKTGLDAGAPGNGHGNGNAYGYTNNH
jgi:hypothetical protein